jgi:hypothetical protein
MRFDRRQFLKSLAVATGAGVLAHIDGAQAGPSTFTKKRFVFVEFLGAWDTLLGLDPRDPSVFTESQVSSTGIELGYHLLPAFYAGRGVTSYDGVEFGPAVPDRFGQLAAKMCLGRGFSMDTLSHEVGRTYWSTGRAPTGSNPSCPSVASQIVDQIAQNDPANLGFIPNLAINGSVFSDATDPALRPFQVRNATDMMLALALGSDPFSKYILDDLALADALTAYRKEAVLCDPARLDRHGKMKLLRQSQEKVVEIVKSGLSNHFNFTNFADPEMAALQAHYGYFDVDAPAALAALAAQAIKLGLSRCVTLQFRTSFDDHDGKWADDQPVDQYQAFDAVARLYEDLAATPTPEDPSVMLSENTVIVLGSDFSRTPVLNGTQGRDHWPVNCCAFLGGLPPGVVGASTYHGMESQKVDPATGGAVAPDTPGAVALNPGHFMASLLANEGLSLEHLREAPVECLTI